MEETPQLLHSGDAALALPRMGGMARPNGVVIVSERYWAFAGVDGSLREGRMPKPPEIVHSIPRAAARPARRLALADVPAQRRRAAAGAVPDPRRRARADRLRVPAEPLVD